jgi:hypothetical protein
MALPSQIKATALSGIAEADETYTLRSFKGQRRALAMAQRPSRKRGATQQSVG